MIFILFSQFVLFVSLPNHFSFYSFQQNRLSSHYFLIILHTKTLHLFYFILSYFFQSILKHFKLFICNCGATFAKVESLICLHSCLLTFVTLAEIYFLFVICCLVTQCYRVTYDSITMIFFFLILLMYNIALL